MLKHKKSQENNTTKFKIQYQLQVDSQNKIILKMTISFLKKRNKKI